MSDAAALSRAGLIAPEADTRWHEGAGILEAAAGMVEGFHEDNQGAGFGNMAVIGLSTLGAVLDPFQAVFAAGVGWLMEHLDCLRDPLDSLLGDPKEIEGHAETWRNLQRRTYEATEYFAGQVTTSTASWVSDAVTAYRVKASAMADGSLALGEVAEAMAEATLIAGATVGVFRNMVRDLIAEVVGAAISKAVQALLVVTIPKVLAEVALMIAEWSGRIVQVMRRLNDAIAALGRKFPALVEVCAGATRMMDSSIDDLAYGSTFLNSSKLYPADSYVSDSTGARGGFKHAYDALSQGESVVHGSKRAMAVDALREGLKLNSVQNGGTTAGSLPDDKIDRPRLDLPL